MMEDTDLAAIRAKRMAELQAQQGGGVPGGGPGGADKEAQQRQMEEMRRNMLASILNNQARERLNRISIVKPEKARAVEELIIRMARTGQLQGKVGEPQLIDLLEQLRATTEHQEPKLVINRRRFDDSDDEEEYTFK